MTSEEKKHKSASADTIYLKQFAKINKSINMNFANDTLYQISVDYQTDSDILKKALARKEFDTPDDDNSENEINKNDTNTAVMILDDNITSKNFDALQNQKTNFEESNRRNSSTSMQKVKLKIKSRSSTLEESLYMANYENYISLMDTALKSYALQKNNKYNDHEFQNIMQQLLNETIKFRNYDLSTKKLPHEQMSDLISMLEETVDKGSSLALHSDSGSNVEGCERTINVASNACLIILYLWTTNEDFQFENKSFCLNGDLAKVVTFIKYQIIKTIIPEFEFCNRMEDEYDSKGKDKQKNTVINVPTNKHITVLYHKLSEIISRLSKLLTPVTFEMDSIISLINVAFSIFRLENAIDLQNSCLQMIVAIIARFESNDCRMMIIDELLSPLATKIVGTYYAPDGTEMHLYSALILQVIQASAFSDKCDKRGHSNVLLSKYIDMFEIASYILEQMLKQYSQKIEFADYKFLLENFFKDLTTTMHKLEWPVANYIINLIGQKLYKEKELRSVCLEYLGTIATAMIKTLLDIDQQQEETELLIVSIEKEKASKSYVHLKDNNDTKYFKQLVFLQDYVVDYLESAAEKIDTFCLLRDFYTVLWTTNFYLINETINTKVKYGGKEKMEAKKHLLRRINNLKKRTVSFNNRRKTDSICAPNIRNEPNYKTIELLLHYITLKTNFFECSKFYISMLREAMSDSRTVVKIKALRSISLTVESYPFILDLNSLNKLLQLSLEDTAASVRELAVELFGKFLLKNPQLLERYINVLYKQLKDNSPNVRKHVIKVLANTYKAYPDKLEICYCLARKHSGSSSAKTVLDLFEAVWFHVKNGAQRIIKAVQKANEEQLSDLQGVLLSIFKRNNERPSTKDETSTYDKTCSQIIQGLVDKTEQEHGEESLFQYTKALELFANTEPALVLKHVSALTGILTIKINVNIKADVIANIIKILKLILPFAKQQQMNCVLELQNQLIKLITYEERTIVEEAIPCLSIIVCRLTGNFPIVKDCFDFFYSLFNKIINLVILNRPDEINLQHLKRTLLTIGLFLRYFDFANSKLANKENLPKNILEKMKLLLKSDPQIQLTVLHTLGIISIKYEWFWLDTTFKDTCTRMLQSDEEQHDKVKISILSNMKEYLAEQIRSEEEQTVGEQALTDMCNNLVETSNIIIQNYLSFILDSFISKQLYIRKLSARIICQVYEQGFVNPVQIIPHLICMSTDVDVNISTAVQSQLQEAKQKYFGFLYSKIMQGIKLSFTLYKKAIMPLTSVVRGIRDIETKDKRKAICEFVYTLLKNSKQGRRGLLLNILKQFEKSEKNNLEFLLFLADNLSAFPYDILDDVYFLVHHIDNISMIYGSNTLELLQMQILKINKETFDKDEQQLFDLIPNDNHFLDSCLYKFHVCLLLLKLKKHLKVMYKLEEEKINKYSPLEPIKSNELVSRPKRVKAFFPESTVKLCIYENEKILEQKKEDVEKVKKAQEMLKKDVLKEFPVFQKLILLEGDDEELDEENKKQEKKDKNKEEVSKKEVRNNKKEKEDTRKVEDKNRKKEKRNKKRNKEKEGKRRKEKEDKRRRKEKENILRKRKKRDEIMEDDEDFLPPMKKIKK